VYGLDQIPTGNIERIEVIKGASSALYGSSAIGGVINIITKKPGIKPMVNVGLQYGSYNTARYNIGASARVRNMDAMITAQKHSGDEIDEDDDRLTDRVKSDNVALSARLSWSEVLGDDKLTFTGRALNENRAGGDLDTFENPFAESAENITTTRYEAGMGYNKFFNAGNEISLNLAYAIHHRDATNDSFLGDYMETHAGEVPREDEMRPYLADEILYVADAYYAHPIGNRHRVLLGGIYSRNELDEEGKYVIVDDTDPDYGQSYLSESEKWADEYGVYIQDEFSIMKERLELVIGGRYDHHKSRDEFAGSGDISMKEFEPVEYEEEAYNPRVALMYRPLPKLTFRASYGTGFRVPYGFSEDLHLCSGSPRVYKPGDLEPEKSESYSVSADYATPKIWLGLNLFRTNLKDKIGFSDASETAKKLNYTYEWENIGHAYTQGVELSSRIVLLEDLFFDLFATYTDAQYEDEREDWVNHPVHGDEYADESKYIPRVPEYTGGITLNWTPGRWNMSLNGDYKGAMYIDYCEEEDVEMPGSEIYHTPAFWVLNSKISREFPGSGLKLFAGGKNLLDYVQDDKRPDDAAFMWGPDIGTEYYAGMEVSF
jgi:outer membrane receptor for ferrienterochelin and colicins